MCVCVSVYVCVCLCGRNNFPRLLVAASDSAYRKYDKLKLFDVWVLLKTYGSKVIARNTFQDAFVETERTVGRHGAYQKLSLT